ncbi:unnamed protein product [Cladocopium goreaui]|uniref:Uncharacterized protein n=1 Tax=Cladocopium goreaui TaxID=2562237 RepID=A0A9P1DIQ1_9DINO|nr:unnamed protein product [Cladocopium goreaui]
MTSQKCAKRGSCESCGPRSELEYDPLAHQRVTDEPLPDLPLPAPKRFKRSALEPEEPPFVQEASPAKNRKRKRVTDEPLPDLPLPAPKRFKRSAPEPEEPPFVQEASPATNLKRKRLPENDPLAFQRVTDEPLPDLPLPAPKRFKRSALEPEEPPFVQEASPATNLKRKRSPENDPLAFQRVTDEPLPDLPLPAPKRFKRSAPEPEEPPFVQEASPATNLKRKRLLENDPLAFQRVTDEPLPDLPLPAPNSFKRSAPEPEEPPLMQEVPKAPMSTAAPVTAAAIECSLAQNRGGGAQVHWASCSKRDGCRYVKKADVSRCGVSQHGCYDESQLLSECQSLGADPGAVQIQVRGKRL